MQKIRIAVSFGGVFGPDQMVAITEVAGRAGVPVDIVAPGWQITGEAPPTIRATYDLETALGPHGGSPADDWLKTGLEALLATYEALPPDSPPRKLGRQAGFGWVGGSNRLPGAPHDVCAEIRALLAAG